MGKGQPDDFRLDPVFVALLSEYILSGGLGLPAVGVVQTPFWSGLVGQRQGTGGSSLQRSAWLKGGAVEVGWVRLRG